MFAILYLFLLQPSGGKSSLLDKVAAAADRRNVCADIGRIQKSVHRKSL